MPPVESETGENLKEISATNGTENGTLPDSPVSALIGNNVEHNDDIQQTNGTNATAQAALQRSLNLLKDMDADPNIEEIKKLDSQIDHFNNYLDKFEAKNNELNKKLNELLEAQKEERLKRKASFEQREMEYKEQSNSLRDQMQALLSRCHVARGKPDDATLVTNGQETNNLA
uniref:Uncharacterized protein n=1 Tax=Romanomermis culicivorax TaxID=13658 RepID=A0A915JY37_ROMCU